ncbi:MAG: trigger factor family protein, partial [Chloroflexi bacterium]|nr:trigger factor family protein [Chloroflexota bacterium]
MTARQQRKKSKQPQEEAVLPLTVASQERLERSRVALTVAVDSEVVRRETDRSYQALGNRYQVPGFRRGKAPHAILKTYLGEERIRQEMIESLLPKAYRQAVLDSGVEIIPDADPDVEILEATLDGTVTFKATVPVAPTVELGDYQSIHIERQPVEITDAQVDETIERLRRARAT